MMTAHIIDGRKHFQRRRREPIEGSKWTRPYDPLDCIRTGADATMPKPFLNDESDGGHVA